MIGVLLLLVAVGCGIGYELQCIREELGEIRRAVYFAARGLNE